MPQTNTRARRRQRRARGRKPRTTLPPGEPVINPAAWADKDPKDMAGMLTLFVVKHRSPHVLLAELLPDGQPFAKTQSPGKFSRFHKALTAACRIIDGPRPAAAGSKPAARKARGAA